MWKWWYQVMDYECDKGNWRSKRSKLQLPGHAYVKGVEPLDPLNSQRPQCPADDAQEYIGDEETVGHKSEECK